MVKTKSSLDKLVTRMDTAYDKMYHHHHKGNKKLMEKWYKEYDKLYTEFKNKKSPSQHWSTYNRWWGKTKYVPLSKRRKKR